MLCLVSPLMHPRIRTEELMECAARLETADYFAHPGYGHGSVHDLLFHLQAVPQPDLVDEDRRRLDAHCVRSHSALATLRAQYFPRAVFSKARMVISSATRLLDAEGTPRATQSSVTGPAASGGCFRRSGSGRGAR